MGPGHASLIYHPPTVHPHTHPLPTRRFPDSASFLACTHRTVGVWGLGGGAAPLRRLQAPHAFIYDAAVWPGGDYVVTVGEDRRVAFTRCAHA